MIILIFQQINFTLTLDHTKSQWVDLGIHTEVCMTRPDTCGAAGGAISVWVRMIDCRPNSFCGIISSITGLGGSSAGSVIFGHSGSIRYETHYPNFYRKDT